MRTVAIVSQKGGSGKTTIAVHLAVCAERAGKPTLILDLDPQGSAMAWLKRRGDDVPEVIATDAGKLAGMLAKAKKGGAGFISRDTRTAD
jgi:chromosome partitioning protein